MDKTIQPTSEDDQVFHRTLESNPHKVAACLNDEKAEETLEILRTSTCPSSARVNIPQDSAGDNTRRAHEVVSAPPRRNKNRHSVSRSHPDKGSRGCKATVISLADDLSQT
jgi:hypothetical protein